MTSLALDLAARGLALRPPGWLRLLLRNRKAAFGTGLLAVIVFAAVFAPLLTADKPTGSDVPGGLGPSWSHPFGTSDQGTDIFAQVLYGARLSLITGGAAAVISIGIATALGLLAAYRGGWVDDVIGLVTSVFLVLPRLPLLIILALFLPPQSTLVIIGMISLVNWAVEMRILRSQALSLRERDFILAAKTSGESTLRIVFGEFLPNMLSRVAAGFLFVFVQAIFVAAALDFLGFGDTQKVSWGTSLYWAYNNEALFSGKWWGFFFPGMAIAITALALTCINYGIDELSNPKLRRQRRRWRKR